MSSSPRRSRKGTGSASSNATPTGRSPTGTRSSHTPPVTATNFPTQAAQPQFPHYPFQPLPPPNGPAPFRFDLSQLLSPAEVASIKGAGLLVCHTVGDTGDYRGQQQDFVASMMGQDVEKSVNNLKPVFCYHLGDVVYFAGDIDRYGANFYETYKDYPIYIVAIPGNHDCQPDDPLDGPVNPKKVPLDGWVQNFMSKDPAQLGSLKTSSGRTQMDLPMCTGRSRRRWPRSSACSPTWARPRARYTPTKWLGSKAS